MEQPPPMNWPLQLQQVLAHEPCVVVTMKLILGSAPRESGCRMIVTADRIFGSIGGGNLEYTAIRQSREWLNQSITPRQIYQPYGLGPALNQCCGGAVILHYEVCSGICPVWLRELTAENNAQAALVLVMAIDRPEPMRWLLGGGDQPKQALPQPVLEVAHDLLRETNGASDLQADISEIVEVEAAGEKWWLQRAPQRFPALVLFGAGHVGQEVALLLQRLPFAVTWVDNRQGVFPASIAANIRMVRTDHPSTEVVAAVPSSIFVVMTHSHQLDEDLCLEILRRGDFCWLGLIGSQTKRRRFVQRLNKRGVNAGQLERLCCPLGLDGIHGKQPATIALSLAAQLMMEKPWIHANN